MNYTEARNVVVDDRLYINYSWWTVRAVVKYNNLIAFTVGNNDGTFIGTLSVDYNEIVQYQPEGVSTF